MAQAAGYSFNSDTVSGSTVRDLAGYFLTGTIVGSAAITAGKTGYGNALNCTGGALQVPVEVDTYPVNTSGGLSVAAWVKLNTTTAAARCIASGKSVTQLDWALYASNGSGNVSAVVNGTTYNTTVSIRDSGWHHVMLVVDRVSGPGAETLRIVIDGVQQLNSTGLTTNLGYPGGGIIIEAGRNAFTATEALDGLVDDFRWWNDPVSSASWSAVMGTEMVDLQVATYPFDGTVEDYSVYNRDLTKAASGSFVDGFYGKALASTTAAAAATVTANFGDMDRLAVLGWMRLDTAPVGSSKPIMAITDTGGTAKFRAVVNTDRTVTLTWVTIYGTFSVTSGSALTVGTWTRYHFNMNPTYVGIRLGGNTQVQTSTGNSDPHLTPTVLDLKTLYIGGDASAGGQVSFDYAAFTQNFIDVPQNNYWTGAPVVAAVKPTNSARGVYEFNENTGTTANDQSAFGNNLTLTAAGSWITGIEGSALGSNGTGPGANKTSGLSWSSTPTGWSFSGWVRCRSGSSGARILVLRNSSSEVAHVFFLSGAFQLRLYGSGGNTGIISPNGSAMTAETWTHIAASCNGDTVQFWKNGVHYGAVTYSQGTLLSPTQLYVGGDDPDGSVADVDSLTLFDTPLSDSNVRWLFENPGEFAQGVPVSNAAATSWNTKAQATGARVTSWDTRTSVAATRSTTWNVLAALIAVSASRSTTWDVLGGVTGSRSTSWNVLAAGTSSVSASRATTWRLLQLATALKSSTWNILSDTGGSGFTVKFPTYRVPLGTVPPLNRQWMDMPKALVKYNNEWLEVAVPYNELLLKAEKFYLGGYQYELSDAEVADLPPQYVEPIS